MRRLDPGPRIFGLAGADWGAQVDLAAPFAGEKRAQRHLRRKIDRQRRANNPTSYLPDGRIRPGPQRWRASQHQRNTERKLAEALRREAAHRTSLHGQLAERVHRCACGITVQRDVWSAYLARLAQVEIGPDGPRWHLDAESACQAFSGAEKYLPAASIPVCVQAFTAWARDHQPASVAPAGGSHLPNGGSEWVVGAVGTRAREGADAVPPQAAERVGLPPEPPGYPVGYSDRRPPSPAAAWLRAARAAPSATSDEHHNPAGAGKRRILTSRHATAQP